MKYFTIKELCYSDTAKKKGIDNTPSDEIIDNLEKLVEHILDPLREAWGKPLKVNSGYRCPELNKAVKGVKTSDHQNGFSADLNAGSKEKNKELFSLAVKLDLPFDQLIDEQNFTWVHISYRDEPRKQILRLS